MWIVSLYFLQKENQKASLDREGTTTEDSVDSMFDRSQIAPTALELQIKQSQDIR